MRFSFEGRERKPRHTGSQVEVRVSQRERIGDRKSADSQHILVGTIWSPCTTMDVLLSQLKITVVVIVISSSPCSISDLKMVTSVLQLSLDEGDLMYRGEGNSSLVVSLTKVCLFLSFSLFASVFLYPISFKYFPSF